MLNELGIEQPSYETFVEQKEYFSKAKKIMKQKRILGPLSWNRPQYFLGKQTREVLDFLKGTEEIDSEAGKRVFNLLSNIMDYYKLFTYEGSDEIPNKSAFGYFLNMKAPLFAGYTNCMEQLEHLKESNLDWDAYPILAYDNTLPLEPIYATVDAQTRLPMECAKFMIHLQEENFQKFFNKRGYITVQREGKYLFDNPALLKAAKESFSGYLEESVDNYLFEHILDSELVVCGIKGKDIKESFENIFHYSRAYMRNFT